MAPELGLPLAIVPDSSKVRVLEIALRPEGNQSNNFAQRSAKSHARNKHKHTRASSRVTNWQTNERSATKLKMEVPIVFVCACVCVCLAARSQDAAREIGGRSFRAEGSRLRFRLLVVVVVCEDSQQAD